MRTIVAAAPGQGAGKTRAASLILAAALTLLASGCGKPAATNKPQTVRIWHWMTDRETALNELARRYTEQTGIPVHFELYAPTDAYVQKIRSAAQTNGLPEVYGILGEMRDLASFVKAGHVLPLEEAMNAENGAWRSEFFPKALAVNAFQKKNPYGIEPGVYGVPIDVMNVQIYYNKKLLRQLGLDPEHPPQTWQDFLLVADLA